MGFMIYGIREEMEEIRERYERALRKRADRLEESGGNRDRDGEEDKDGEINLVLRQEEQEREEEDW